MNPTEMRYDQPQPPNEIVDTIKHEITERKRQYRDSIALLNRAIEELESLEQYLRKTCRSNK